MTRLTSMKGLARILTLTALLALPAVALASGARQVWVPNCTKAQYKPKELTLACGDGTNYLARLTWASWTARSATGRGTDEVNNCTPDCAAGRFRGYPVSVTLSKPRRCRRAPRHRLFSRITLRYTGTHPGRSSTQSGPLACP